MKKNGLTYGLLYFTKEQMNVLDKIARSKNAEWWFDSVEGNSAWYYDIRNLLTDFDYNNVGFSQKEIAFLDECKKI